MNVQFNGPVGQVINAGKIGRIDATVTFDDDGNMVFASSITEVQTEDDE